MDQLPFTWAAEQPRRRFASPYDWRETLRWMRNYCFGPSRKHRGLVSFLPQDTRLAAIDSRRTIAFVGDVMPPFRTSFAAGERLRAFLSDAEYLVLNMEGVISNDRRVLNAMRHDPSILDFLQEFLPPDRTIISFANNHAGDCGWSGFQQCYHLLKSEGYRVFGRRDEPSLSLDGGIQITACSFWSNQPCPFITWFEAIGAEADRQAAFKILYPHWGYELQLYPRPQSVELGRQLLDRWDMVIGHHAHCPQPVTRCGDRLLAYSLGNFTSSFFRERYRYGIVVKTEIGPGSQGTWQTGRVQWRFTRQVPVGQRRCEVELSDDCRFFSGDLSGLPAPAMGEGQR